MATAYTIIAPRPAGVPEPVVVRIVATRADGKALSREELEALAAAYPPPTAEARDAVARAIARAPSRPVAKAKSKAVTGTKAVKVTSKRAAAKRP